MPDLDKLIAKIKARPSEADFVDVRALLEAFGWTERNGKGSHWVFAKEGERSLTVPTISGRKVKRYILDQIIERLGLDN